MIHFFNIFPMVWALLLLLISSGTAQMAGLHGDFSELRRGVHAGNQFRISIFNDGTYGAIFPRTIGEEFLGEWPINSGHNYLIDGNIFVGSEVKDASGNFVKILSENIGAGGGGSRGDQDPVTQEWLTFLPLAGFANPDNDLLAMAKGASEWVVDEKGTWPPYWPDIADPGNERYEPGGWAGSWNGYFGRNRFNADEESYFVADDYNNREFQFFPDSTDLSRRGLGLRLNVRGFQWAKTAVEDAIFSLYDITNIGTYRHDKVVFAYKIGNNMGDDDQGGNGTGSDWAYYIKEEDLAYMWEEGCHPEAFEVSNGRVTDNPGDCIAPSGWYPVGFIGGAFLESPGNPYDGIDNDNDGAGGSGSVINEAMFEPYVLEENTELVLIDYTTYKRKIMTLADTLNNLDANILTIQNGPRNFQFAVGDTAKEIGDNLIDDNFNGLIDENRSGRDAQNNINFLYIQNGQGYKAIDYRTGSGLDNPLLDEKRDDGIDNDGDWDSLTDDTGRDGLAPSNLGYPGPDAGESDGVPTPGEPHFDLTDIDESDQLGLTSVALYEYELFNQYDEEVYWTLMIPGTSIIPEVAQNVELSFGSGYFPLIPGQTERISVGVVLGRDFGELLRNKGYVADAYELNYNFAKAPFLPTVKAIAGDNLVTLFWDSFAEQSVDPIGQSENGGRDFEGYKIYRSTHPGFTDVKAITNSFGDVVFREPLAQFDLINGKSGLHPVTTQGVKFNLGNESGLKHYYQDRTALNGYTYFYAVTAYDHGDEALGIDPSETSKFVAVAPNGDIDRGTNVVVVRPEAPAAGYNEARLLNGEIVPGPANTADGNINIKILDPLAILDNNTYHIEFYEKVVSFDKATHSFKLTNLTTNQVLLDSVPIPAEKDSLPLMDGFQLNFENNADVLTLDSENSGWNREDIPNYEFRRYVFFRDAPADPQPGDFEVIFGETGIDTSTAYTRGTTLLPAIPVNFTVINTISQQKVPFAFLDQYTDNGPGLFEINGSPADEIFLLAEPDSNIASWWIRVNDPARADKSNPAAGDRLTLTLFKPFLSNDTFRFITQAPSIDIEQAKSDLDNIRVVPNPYIVTNAWEARNTYSTGRGERQLHFNHLPQKCTIRIFNVRGQLLRTLYHEAAAADGSEVWDMLSKDRLEISYGIYIYHVDAAGVGQKTGKFLVVK